MYTDLQALLFPEHCRSCGRLLSPATPLLCPGCLLRLPRFPHWDHTENEVFQCFWGRVPFRWATSMLRMGGPGVVKELIHKIKYQDDRTLARFLGARFARQLLECPLLGRVDLLLPLPLHPKRLRKRGYNQSREIALGMSTILDVPIDDHSVQRRLHRESQTGKSRQARWRDLQGAFFCVHPEELRNKHVLLIDDVITTGASLESMAVSLHGIEGLEMTACSLAYVY